MEVIIEVRDDADDGVLKGIDEVYMVDATDELCGQLTNHITMETTHISPRIQDERKYRIRTMGL